MGAADLCSLVVVTAVDEARTGFLDELGASLGAQDVPDGWSVVWSDRWHTDEHDLFVQAALRRARAARAMLRLA